MTASATFQSCAIVDQYSYRAIGYNLEAEQAQLQALLLNIIRGSQRRPMQFTSVQSITGFASSSSTAGLSFPLGPHQSQLSLTTGTLNTTISAGPSFIVPVLDTQEFYHLGLSTEQIPEEKKSPLHASACS